MNQLAFETFERGEYFFKQATAEEHIICYLIGASDDEEAMQLDGEAVLKSIEAQHGLLVERARGIYSFSHLTFQEYFAAQHIVSLTSGLALHNLATHITEKRCREILLLTVGMLPEADILLMLMKQQIDQIMLDNAGDTPKLQPVLSWVQQKATLVNTPYKPVAIRAFYYTWELRRDLVSIHALDLDLAINLAIDLSRNFDNFNDSNLNFADGFALNFDRALDFDFNFDRALTFARALDFGFDIAGQVAMRDPKLKLKIQILRAELPSQDNRETLKKWWLANGETWAERLRAIMSKHRDISHYWLFSDAQREKLRQYYDANKLLVDCLNSDCYVTKATRQYIEDTLLLPLSEIEKYPVPDAIANL